MNFFYCTNLNRACRSKLSCISDRSSFVGHVWCGTTVQGAFLDSHSKAMLALGESLSRHRDCDRFNEVHMKDTGRQVLL